MGEDKSVALAGVAERAGRYDDMMDFMKQRVMTGVPFTTDERDMFSAAFKNALSERRQAVRHALSIAQAERETNHDHYSLAMGYKSRVETELQEICNSLLGILNTSLLPSAAAGEDKTFYLKMQGDYYRYLAEFSEGQQKAGLAEEARAAYDNAMCEASSMDFTHPVRLGLALNFSVFQHEVLQDTQNAVQTATSALDNARKASMEGSPIIENSDADVTMKLLGENLQLWSSEGRQ
mmetsp:Transcript_29947/g.82203  ORF Transcript_29947/g.82203 Transcript_29947/m.82203 type:complete len:236 (+) Transcript_29947:90-797(+)|eukprot:CAMPEP_0117552930 /NCGR_PEP_ID=MMETSP0784-20121206/49962_1 /TAXON_ID=39447 /ORGANISM="" /LENGTH=235 /DNA_ID=CAMNT_0005350019 /DNA_START=90 /DNA_END=797 /DNA_ORIENTATION=+